MKKDFQEWHKIKEKINNLPRKIFFHEREVWWCSIGVNIGFEQDGKGRAFTRPILIIRGFSKEVFLCVPLTTKPKKGKYYYNIFLGDDIERKVILSQIRLLDSKRLQEKIITLDRKQFDRIKKAIIHILR